MKKQEVESLMQTIIDMREEGELQVCVNAERRLGTRFNDCAISQNALRNQTSLSITARLEQKRASVSVNSLADKDTIKRAVQQAFQICKHMPDDEEVLPAMGESLPVSEAAFSKNSDAVQVEDLGQWSAAACSAGSQAKIDLAGMLSLAKLTTAYADSAGGFGYERSHRTDYHVTATGETGSGWAEDQGIEVNADLVMMATERAIEKSVAAQKPVIYDPKPSTVILEPQAVGELLMMGFYYDFDQRAQDEGRSAFSSNLTDLGSLTMFSDPNEKTIPSLSFNSSGQALKKSVWLDEGKLQQFRTSRFWAKKKGIAVKPSPSSLHLSGNGTALEKMIAETEDGILVTRFWYIRSTDAKSLSFTGMTRDGLFRVKEGKVAEAIVDMRWNDSLMRVLKNVTDSGLPVATGEDLSMGVPALKVKDFRFTSLSN